MIRIVENFLTRTAQNDWRWSGWWKFSDNDFSFSFFEVVGYITSGKDFEVENIDANFHFEVSTVDNHFHKVIRETEFGGVGCVGRITDEEYTKFFHLSNFDNYKNHKNDKLDPALFWDLDMNKFDPAKAPNIVVQRVVERGMVSDWQAMFNMFGVDEVKKIIRDLSYLSDRNMSFVSILFEIPINELKCFKRKQLIPRLWNF